MSNTKPMPKERLAEIEWCVSAPDANSTEIEQLFVGAIRELLAAEQYWREIFASSEPCDDWDRCQYCRERSGHWPACPWKAAQE